MPRITKKQLGKEEDFNEDDKLESFLIYNKHDKLVYELKYVKKLTKTYKVFYENEEGNVITQNAYENLTTKGDKYAIEVDKDLSSILMEALEYQRVGKDDSTIKIDYTEESSIPPLGSLRPPLGSLRPVKKEKKKKNI